MKQKIYLLGLITVMVILLGTIFKINHWPGAGVLLTVGLVTFDLVFIPLALINSFKGDGNKNYRLLYIITGITCLIVFTGMLFKIMHWPGAGIMLTLALPFPYVVFLPVFLVVTSRDRNYNIYNTVFVLFLLAVNSVFSAMLALSVSRERINDSYNLARNYNNTESVIQQIPINDQKSAVIARIDEVLQIVNQYRETILNNEGLSVAEWKENPAVLGRPEYTQAAARALEKSGDNPAGTKLYNGLESLMVEISNTPCCEILAKDGPGIFDLNKNDNGESVIIQMYVSLAWSLVYLDELEANLTMIRATLAQKQV
jgi:hypothetical protein